MVQQDLLVLVRSREAAAELLRQAHAAAERMGLPEAAQIRSIQEREGF